MIDYLAVVGPIVIALVIYFVRLETRLARMCTDLDWIKKGCLGCQSREQEDAIKSK